MLGYAKPYRAQIIFALIIGTFAGFLAALNLVAVIPVLDLLFEQNDASHVAQLRESVTELEDAYAAATGWIATADLWITLQKTRFRIAWNEWVLQRQERAIYVLAGLLIVAQVLKCLLDFISKYHLQKAFYLAVVRLRNDLYQRCLHLDMGNFTRLTSGDLLARMNNDMRAVRMVFTSMVSTVALQPVNILFLLAAMLFLNWQMTLIVLVGIPLVGLPISMIGKKLREMGKRDEEEDAKLLSYTQETIQGLPIVKAFTSEKREASRFRRLSRDLARRQIRRERYRLYGPPFVEIMATVTMAVVLSVGAYLILKSDNASMSPAEFIGFLFILTRFHPPIKRISNTYIKIQKSLASADRIFEVIDLDPVIVDKEEAEPLEGFHDAIRFEEVTFSYTQEQAPVLENFSLEIPKGQKVAIVGRTGSGKSTIMRLLLRLYDVDAGRITIDGRDIRDVRISSLRQATALVTQETILFHDTVLENIRYGRPEATREEVEAAARAGYAHDFVMELPQGYDTVLGERANSLSGGQRQRLAIARALLADKPILLLDEATSALDNESEAIVQRAIESLMSNRTVVVIAHRLSTVRKADEIVVMEGGRILERGTYGALLAARGRFHDLVQSAELAEA